MSLGASTPSRPCKLHYVAFTLDLYLQEYKRYFDTEQFGAKSLKGDTERIYDSHSGFIRNTVLGAWPRRWSYQNRRHAILHNDILYVGMLSVGCEKEYAFASQLAAIIIQCYAFSAKDPPKTGH